MLSTQRLKLPRSLGVTFENIFRYDSECKKELATTNAADEAKFSQFMQSHGDRALRYAYVNVRSRPDAEDIAQEAFVRLWRHAGRRGVDTLTAALLYHTITNLCRDRMRYQKRHPEDPTDWVEMTAVQVDDVAMPDDMTVWDAVQGLNLSERQCVVLFYYMDRSLKEAAAVLGVTEQVVKTRLYRARQHLKPILEPVWKENLV